MKFNKLKDALIKCYFVHFVRHCEGEVRSNPYPTSPLAHTDVATLLRFQKSPFNQCFLKEKGIDESLEKDILDFYIAKDKMYLDAAQLIKHTLALILEGAKTNKKPVLVYIYWEPKSNIDDEAKAVFDNHKKEVLEFAQRISKYINFKALTYSEFWAECEKYDFLKSVVAKNKARYEL